MTENSSKLMPATKTQIQETQRRLIRIKAKIKTKTTPKHMIVKLQKIKDKESHLERNQRKNSPYIEEQRITSKFSKP